MYALMPFLGSVWPILVLSFLIECLSLLWTPARDASPAEPRAAPAAGERELARAARAPTARCRSAASWPSCWRPSRRRSGSRSRTSQTHTESLALWLDAGTFVFSAYMVSGRPAARPDRDASPRGWTCEGLGRHEGRASASCSRTRSRARWRRASSRRSWPPAPCSRSGRPSPPTRWARGRPGGGVLVTAFGVGMATGIVRSTSPPRCSTASSSSARRSCWRRSRSFVLAVDAQHLHRRRSSTVVARVFRGRDVGHRLHAAAGERGRRVPRTHVRVAHGRVAAVAVPVADGVPDPRGSRTASTRSTSADSASTCRARAWPCGRRGSGVILAGWFTRSGPQRLRLTKPEGAVARAQAEAPAGDRTVHRLRGRRGRRQGHADALAEEYLRSRGPRRARHARARWDRARRTAARAAARTRRPGKRRRAHRGAAVRRQPRPARGHRDPPGARRGQGRDLRPVRGLVARVPGRGRAAWASRTC